MLFLHKHNAVVEEKFRSFHYVKIPCYENIPLQVKKQVALMNVTYCHIC